MDIDKRYINQLEIIISVFTVIDGKIKVLLFKRDEEPFKGYWMLPSNLLMVTETIENCANDTLYEFVGIKNILIKECNIFSKIDRLPNDRIIANSMVGLINIDEFNLKRKRRNIEFEWFDISNIPKMVYDHGTILKDSICFFKNLIKNNQYLDIFYPNDFTIPELFLLYEQAYDKLLDRRNFRKKILPLIEDTGYKNEIKNGRPPKLYRLKSNKEIVN